MASNMDRSLDEILADRKKSGPRNAGRGHHNNSNQNNSSNGNNNNNSSSNQGGGGASRRRDRQDYPRDGIRKPYRGDQPRKIEEEWVHDRYDDNSRRLSRPPRNGDAGPDADMDADADADRTNAAGAGAVSRGTRIRIDNLHYDLTVADLEGLFKRIGPVLDVDLLYDRAGRSEGVAFVTYGSYDDARTAMREFDGANANGQPIRLSVVPLHDHRRRKPAGNPFDGAVKPGSGRPLAERISRPGGSAKGSGHRNGNGNGSRDGAKHEAGYYNDVDGDADADADESRTSLTAAARRNIDRYVPGSSQRASRSPMPRRDGGRRPGERRGGGGGGGGANGHRSSSNQNGSGATTAGNNRRPKKTQEELDAEMEDYFGGGGGGSQPAAGAGAVDEDDADMIG